MMARYFPPGREWILVRIMEDLGDHYKILPEPHYRFAREILIVPKHLIERLSSE